MVGHYEYDEYILTFNMYMYVLGSAPVDLCPRLNPPFLRF